MMTGMDFKRKGGLYEKDCDLSSDFFDVGCRGGNFCPAYDEMERERRMGPGSQYGRMYDPKTIETITGTVEKVDKITLGKGMSYGVHLAVKTEKETIDVHLGPGWYIENQDVKLTPGDKVEIKGSRITFQGKPVIIAAEVKKGEETLKLRDESGFPSWAGWRRR